MKRAIRQGLRGPAGVRAVARVLGDRSGATIVEFAVVAPVLFVLLLGMYDIGNTVYVSTVLQGAVYDVARNATLENTSITKADDYVKSMVSGVAPDAQFDFKRTSYYDFSDIERAEVWNDRDGNNECDNGENYTDENRNGQWDADIGQSGNGGANDVVLYSVTVNYEPLFPIPLLSYVDGKRQVKASAVQKNQPYALQMNHGSQVLSCR